MCVFEHATYCNSAWHMQRTMSVGDQDQMQRVKTTDHRRRRECQASFRRGYTISHPAILSLESMLPHGWW